MNTTQLYYQRQFIIFLTLFLDQEKLVRENFNIEGEAHGARRPVVRYFNATVTDSTLEIRFYWAGKGTTRIPNRGDYGSLVSAISVTPSEYFQWFCFLYIILFYKRFYLFIYLLLFADFKVCSYGNKKNVTAYIVAAVLALCVIFLISSILWWKGFFKGKKQVGKGMWANF